jgi:ribulose-phosphate 3-epimerase
MPGFGGQSFDRVALEKLSTLRDRPDVDAFLEVDGGVNLDTIGECTAAGANLLVVGSAISSGNSYRERFAELAARIQ